jgi:hypothetical protein
MFHSRLNRMPSPFQTLKAGLFLAASILFLHETGWSAEVSRPQEKIDLSHWKLTLPISAPGSTVSSPSEIPAAQLTTGYTNAPYFTTGSLGEIIFWCPVNGVTTKNSTYPRTEFREQIAPPSDEACWTATGTHVLDARCRVSQVSSSQKVIIGQIHSYSGKAKPLLKLQFFKNRIEALVKESPTKGKDIKLTFPDVGLDKDFDYQIKLQDGLLSITVNGTTQTENIFKDAPDWANQTFYFKAGAYVQDNEGSASEGARVSFSKLQTSHAGDVKTN